jgi:hypothetical protein
MKLPGSVKLPSLTVVSFAEPIDSSANEKRGSAPTIGMAAVDWINLLRDSISGFLPL